MKCCTVSWSCDSLLFSEDSRQFEEDSISVRNTAWASETVGNLINSNINKTDITDIK